MPTRLEFSLSGAELELSAEGGAPTRASSAALTSQAKRGGVAMLLMPTLILALAAGCFRPASLPRTLTVRVATDAGFRAREGWERTVRERVATVSKAYDREFQLRWVVADLVAWDPAASADGGSVLRQLERDVARGTVDVLIGIVSRPRADGIIGSAIAFLPSVVVFDGPTDPEAINAAILAHELAHLFGAWHVEEHESVMYARPTTLSFDPRSAAVIRLTRHLDFRQGVAGVDRETARRLTQAFVEARAGGEPNPLARAHSHLGLLLKERGELESAVANFREAVAVDPSDPVPHYNLGLALADQGAIDAAIAEFREVIRLNPRDADAYHNLGAALARRGQRRAAIAAFRDALRVRPDNPRPHYNLGTLLVRQPGQLDQGVAELREALRLKPDYDEARHNLAVALKAREELAFAVRRYGERVKASPRDTDARQKLGVALVRQGQFETAIRELREVVRHTPNSGEAYAALATALSGVGRRPEALEALRKARDLGATLEPDLTAAIEESNSATW